MNKCKFCNEYKNLNKIYTKTSSRDNCNPDANMDIKYNQRVSIITKTKRRLHGTSVWMKGGETFHGDYPVHYCPVCGKKL